MEEFNQFQIQRKNLKKSRQKWLNTLGNIILAYIMLINIKYQIECNKVSVFRVAKVSTFRN